MDNGMITVAAAAATTMGVYTLENPSISRAVRDFSREACSTSFESADTVESSAVAVAFMRSDAFPVLMVPLVTCTLPNAELVSTGCELITWHQ